jgi:hypothetical protein
MTLITVIIDVVSNTAGFNERTIKATILKTNNTKIGTYFLDIIFLILNRDKTPIKKINTAHIAYKNLTLGPSVYIITKLFINCIGKIKINIVDIMQVIKIAYCDIIKNFFFSPIEIFAIYKVNNAAQYNIYNK